MMSRRLRNRQFLLSLFAFSLMIASVPAWAESPARTGWSAGISLGVGPGGATDGAGESASTEDGASAQIRIGKMVGPRLMLGTEYEGWLIELGSLEEKYRRSLQTWSLALTYYPGELDANGFYLRGGGGLALGGRAEVPLFQDPELGIIQEHGNRDDEWGWGLVAGVGYEHRITSHMAAGFGLSYNYLSLGEIWYDTAWFGSATLNLGWYF